MRISAFQSRCTMTAHTFIISCWNERKWVNLKGVVQQTGRLCWHPMEEPSWLTVIFNNVIIFGSLLCGLDHDTYSFVFWSFILLSFRICYGFCNSSCWLYLSGNRHTSCNIKWTTAESELKVTSTLGLSSTTQCIHSFSCSKRRTKELLKKRANTISDWVNSSTVLSWQGHLTRSL